MAAGFGGSHEESRRRPSNTDGAFEEGQTLRRRPFGLFEEGHATMLFFKKKAKKAKVCVIARTSP